VRRHLGMKFEIHNRPKEAGRYFKGSGEILQRKWGDTSKRH